MRFGGLSVRVHLEADGVSSGEGFSCWARHFPAGILFVFQGKMTVDCKMKFGMQGVLSKQLELPFLESLLTFLELDEKEITPMLERISVNWEHFVESSDLGARCV